jgi:hypothetical protein
VGFFSARCDSARWLYFGRRRIGGGFEGGGGEGRGFVARLNGLRARGSTLWWLRRGGLVLVLVLVLNLKLSSFLARAGRRRFSHSPFAYSKSSARIRSPLSFKKGSPSSKETGDSMCFLHRKIGPNLGCRMQNVMAFLMGHYKSNRRSIVTQISPSRQSHALSLVAATISPKIDWLLQLLLGISVTRHYPTPHRTGVSFYLGLGTRCARGRGDRVG